MSPLNTFFEFIPLYIIFPTIYFIIKLSLEYTTRKKLIEKGLVGEDIKYLFNSNGRDRYLPSSLKWGLVLLFVGAVTIFLKLLPGYIEGEVIFGAMLIAAGAGLLVYYFLAAAKAKSIEQEPIQ
jgi:hypothetical protein